MGQNFSNLRVQKQMWDTSTGSWPEVVGLTVSHFGAKLLGMMGRNLQCGCLRWPLGRYLQSPVSFLLPGWWSWQIWPGSEKLNLGKHWLVWLQCKPHKKSIWGYLFCDEMLLPIAVVRLQNAPERHFLLKKKIRWYKVHVEELDWTIEEQRPAS